MRKRLSKEGTFTSDCPSCNRSPPVPEQILPYSAQPIDRLRPPPKASNHSGTSTVGQKQLHSQQQKGVLASQQGGFGGLHTGSGRQVMVAGVTGCQGGEIYRAEAGLVRHSSFLYAASVLKDSQALSQLASK